LGPLGQRAAVTIAVPAGPDRCRTGRIPPVPGPRAAPISPRPKRRRRRRRQRGAPLHRHRPPASAIALRPSSVPMGSCGAFGGNESATRPVQVMHQGHASGRRLLEGARLRQEAVDAGWLARLRVGRVTTLRSSSIDSIERQPLLFYPLCTRRARFIIG
jgi:hypothetical protein